jgi:tetratricopeptide (TPR) repeat protein
MDVSIVVPTVRRPAAPLGCCINSCLAQTGLDTLAYERARSCITQAGHVDRSSTHTSRVPGSRTRGTTGSRERVHRLSPSSTTTSERNVASATAADARARMVAATAYFFNKQLDLFEREAQQALELAPHDGEISAVLGHLIASSGQWERGVALVQKANALNADAAIGWYQVAMYYYYYLGRGTTNAH